MATATCHPRLRTNDGSRCSSAARDPRFTTNADGRRVPAACHRRSKRNADSRCAKQLLILVPPGERRVGAPAVHSALTGVCSLWAPAICYACFQRNAQSRCTIATSYPCSPGERRGRRRKPPKRVSTEEGTSCSSYSLQNEC